MDERTETLLRESQARVDAKGRQAGSVTLDGALDGVPAATVAAEAPGEAQPEEGSNEQIVVPKWRFDEINSKYQELKAQGQSPIPQTVTPPAPQPFQPELDEQKIRQIVAAETAPLKVRQEVTELLAKYNDLSDFAPKALERIKSNPSLSLEDAYRLEKFEHLESKAKEEGKKEAYQTIERKEALNTESPGRKIPTPSLDELVADRTVPLSEIAKMLPRE